jgi:sugar phosphate isomerase/epimerase
MAEVICSTAPFFLRPVREAFRHIADAGFTGTEVMVTRDPDTQDPTSLFAAASEFGLEVRAIHAPFLLLNRWLWGPDPVRKVTRSIEMASVVGASTVIVHPPYRWQGAYARWLAEQMPALAERHGVTVAVENMFPLAPRGLPGPRLHDHGPLETSMNRVLDTSHAAVAGWDLAETAARWGERLSHVHLSNNNGKGWDSHLPVDEGVLPLGELLASLDGFDGAVSLELDLRRFMKDAATMNRVLVRNREFCEEHSSLPLSVA